MTIKRGDLVVCLIGDNPISQEHAGKIATVIGPSRDWGDHWVLNPPMISSNGEEMDWATKNLKKIDPPATGEYDRVPVRRKLPRKEVA